jgi:hypothetical protein
MLHKGGNYFYVLRNVLYFELRTENIAVKTHGLIAIYIVHSVPTKLQFQESSIKLCFFFFFNVSTQEGEWGFELETFIS